MPLRSNLGEREVPVDRAEIRRLAKDREILLMIRVIDFVFNKLCLRACPELAGKEAEERIEDYWLMMKEGDLRLCDDEIDDDGVIIAKAETPGQRARARRVGAKLFAVRQLIRRAA